MKNSKRILKVTIKRMVDESPDTSWLGEYSTSLESDFTIDRAHEEDCLYHDYARHEAQEARDVLERIQTHLEDGDIDSYSLIDGQHTKDIQAAIKTIEDLRQEFDCSCITYNWNRREYRYFNPSFNYVDKQGHALPENTPDEVRKYVRQDYERMESLNAGRWGFIGIRVEADIVLKSFGRWSVETNMFTGGCGPIQTITSGGLWGIESDSDASYFAEVVKDELADLRAQLKAIGFSTRAISNAFKSVQEEND